MKIKFRFACVGSFVLVLEVELCGDWFGKQMIQHKVISQLDWMEFFSQRQFHSQRFSS